MRKVVFDPPSGLDEEQTAWWSHWLKRAADGRAALAAAMLRGEPAEFNSSIWRDLKDWLLTNVFRGKCAYCESKVKAVYPGDGEHYRPKGNVTVRVDGVKRRVLRGAGQDDAHRGYHWLAYDWRNLLPACYACNNAKSDQFPVEGEHVHDEAPGPDELDMSERPLLIYPYRDEPTDYLVFGDHGLVAARDDDPRGLATIAVFDLNRDELVDARLQRQVDSQSALAAAVGRAVVEGKPIADFLNGWVDEGAPYSRSVQAFARLRLADADLSL